MKVKGKVITKKVLSTILLLAMIVMQTAFFPAKVDANSSTFALTTTKTTALVGGDEVEIKVSVTGDGIGDFEGLFFYDTDVFEEIQQSDITLNKAGWQFNTVEGLDVPYGYTELAQDIAVTDPMNNYVVGDILTIRMHVKPRVNVNNSVIEIKDIEASGADGFSVDTSDVSLTVGAEAVAPTYTITYNANTTDSVTGLPSAGTKTEGVAYTIAAGPTRTGYDFTGWNTSASGTGGTAYAAGSSYTTDSNLTLYAQWTKKTITVTINPGAGTYSGTTPLSGNYNETVTITGTATPSSTNKGYTVTFNPGYGSLVGMVSNTIIQDKEFDKWQKTSGDGTLTGNTYLCREQNAVIEAVYKNSAITLPNAQRDGYTFDGWGTSTSGTANAGAAGATYNPTSNVTLYAHWLGADYTCNFNYNGGSGSTASKTVTNGGTYGTLPTPNERVGWTFAGWYTDETAGSQVTASTTVNITADTTLYAHWDRLQTTLTVNPNGGIWEGSTSQRTFTEDFESTKVIANPTHVAKTITFDARGGTATQDIINQPVDFDSWTCSVAVAWDDSTSTYTFGPTNATLTANYVDRGITLPNVTKTGAEFNGWYTAATGGTLVGTAGQTVVPTTTTLYAQYTETLYTLSVDPNGGTWNSATTVQTVQGGYNTTTTIANPTAPAGYAVVCYNNDDTTNSQTVNQTQTFTEWTGTGTANLSGTTYTFPTEDLAIQANYDRNSITLPSVSRTGYSFDGWFTEATAGTRVGGIGDTYMPTGDTNLYAHWTLEDYRVTFNPGSDATVAPTSMIVHYGETYAGLPTPVRAGYDFTGWYDESNNQVQDGDTVTITANAEFTAHWSGKQYTVTFDYGDGSTTSKTVTNGQPYGTLATVGTVEGKTFVGWYTDQTDGTKIESTTIVALTGPQILYARWETADATVTVDPAGGIWRDSTSAQSITQKYNTLVTIEDPTHDQIVITFDPQGGTAGSTTASQNVTFDAWTVTGGSFNPPTQEYLFNSLSGTLTATYTYDNITLPTVAKPGASFKGWYTAATGGDRVGDQNDSITPTQTVYYAQWDEDLYTLTIDPNGGTWRGSTEVQTVQGHYNEEVTIEKPEGPDGFTITIHKNDGTIDIEPVVQTLKFNEWTGTGVDGLYVNGTTYAFSIQDEALTATYTPQKVTLPTMTREGYTFKEYNTQSDGNGSKIENLTFVPDADMDIYAIWTANTYQVTFNPDGGTVDPTSKTVTYDQLYGELPTPEREGYNFEGWFDSSNNKIEATDMVKITTDTELTARWDGAEYTLIFDYNGGNGTPASKTIKNTQAYGTLPTASKDRHVFLGWYDASDNKVEETDIVNTTSDITLTAKYEQNEYTLIFDYDGGNGTPASKSITNGSAYGTLPTASKDRHVFLGWYDASNNKVEETDIVNTTSDITLKAKYEQNEFRLIFDYDGGNGTPVSKPIVNGAAYGTFPSPTKQGHSFVGWFDASNNKVEETDIVNTTSDITLKAKYEKDKFNVEFKNDDNTVIATKEVEYGDSCAYDGQEPSATVSRRGYTSRFTGWSNSDKLSNVTENITLVAQYEYIPTEYTIEYRNTKDADTTVNPSTYTIADGDLTLNPLSNSGKYQFMGWVDVDGNDITSIDTSRLESIIVYANWYNDSLYLRSAKYKIGKTNINEYVNGDKYIDKIEPDTTVAQFKANCDTNGKIVVMDKDGHILRNDEYIGTGMIVEDTRYDERIVVTAVVMDDLDGNGHVTATDLSALNQTVLDILTLEEPAFLAADLDDNTRLTATDLSTINQVILDVLRLVYNKPLF